MTTVPNKYEVQFEGNDIVFRFFVDMQVVARAEYQDGAWLLVYFVPTYKEVRYAENIQEVMEWANKNFGWDEE